jgi:hypothetical protein
VIHEKTNHPFDIQHQHARLAQQQQQEGRWTELQDLESTVWATIEMYAIFFTPMPFFQSS